LRNLIWEILGISLKLNFSANTLGYYGLIEVVMSDALVFGCVSGGSGQLQWFFAIVALANVLIVVVFLPETHGKSLQEIEEHFDNNTLWLCRKRPARDAAAEMPPITVSVVPLAAGGA